MLATVWIVDDSRASTHSCDCGARTAVVTAVASSARSATAVTRRPPAVSAPAVAASAVAAATIAAAAHAAAAVTAAAHATTRLLRHWRTLSPGIPMHLALPWRSSSVRL